MSSTTHPDTAAEKLDVRKYLSILHRRMWWGIIPFLLIAVAFTILCLAMPPKYQSSCVIRASKNEVAAIIGSETATRRASIEIYREEMLRYDRVLAAMNGSGIMAEAEARAGNNPAELSRLRDKLLTDIQENTRIVSLGEGLIGVSYLADSAAHAQEVLSRLVQVFVERALSQEWEAVRKARELAQDEMGKSKEALDALENQLVTFQKEHPEIVAISGTSRDNLADVSRELQTLDGDIKQKQKVLAKYREQVDSMPGKTIKERRPGISPEVNVYRTKLAELQNQLAMLLKIYLPAHPAVQDLQKQIQATQDQLAEAERHSGESEGEIVIEENTQRVQKQDQISNLEAELDGLLEAQRNLAGRKTALQDRLNSLPELQRQFSQLTRDRSTAADRYDRSLSNFRRIDQDYNTKKEGIVSFVVISPPREPQTSSVRHILRMAMIGLFVSLAAGVGAIAGTEFLDQSFSDVESARDFLRLPSLGIIPYIETERQHRIRLLRRLVLLALALAVLAVAGLLLYFTGIASSAWHLIQEFAKTLA